MSAVQWLSTMTEILEHLERGELNVTGLLVDASNATLFAQCTYAQSEMAVIYKPVAGERPLWDFPDGNLAQREFAAYLLSEASGLKVVPPTVLRDGPFGIGMVQQCITIDENVDLAKFYREDLPELRGMALFDAIINNTDRKIGHLLPHIDGHLYGCDHGVTFHADDKLRTVLWQWANQQMTDEEVSLIAGLTEMITSRSLDLTSLLTAIEIEALLARIARLKEVRKFPVPSGEWPAVPWPPF